MLTSPQASDRILNCPLPEGCEVRDISDQFNLDSRFAVYGIYSDTGVKCAYVTLYSNDNSTLVMASIKVMLSCDSQYSQLGMEWANSCLNKLYPQMDNSLLEELTSEHPWSLESLREIQSGVTYTNSIYGESQKLVYDLMGRQYASIQLWYMEE